MSAVLEDRKSVELRESAHEKFWEVTKWQEKGAAFKVWPKESGYLSLLSTGGAVWFGQPKLMQLTEGLKILEPKVVVPKPTTHSAQSTVSFAVLAWVTLPSTG